MPLLLDQRRKRSADRLATVSRSRGAQDEIEILLASGLEVPHLVVDAKPDETPLANDFRASRQLEMRSNRIPQQAIFE